MTDYNASNTFYSIKKEWGKYLIVKMTVDVISKHEDYDTAYKELYKIWENISK